MEWSFLHCYGEAPGMTAGEVNEVTTLQYDTTGQFLAVGDRAGRLNILERRTSKEGVAYEPYHQLQCYVSEFDYLKSVEIEAHINQIRWLSKCNPANLLLAANDKTIKLWRVAERRARGVPVANGFLGGGAVTTIAPSIKHTLRRSYANAHAYHINSVSPNSDGETFISADDLRINLWHLEHPASQTILDIKPSNMEDLTEVITAASFHPQHCSVLAYCTSKGVIKMADLRESFNVRQHCRVLELEDDPAHRTFFSEIIGSLSDIKFSPDGRFILARDYLTLKIWDLTVEAHPIRTVRLHEGLRPHLCELYENDCIFDKFECAWGSNGSQVVTGSYKNQFKVQGTTSLCTATPTALPPLATVEAGRVKPEKRRPLMGMSLAKAKGAGSKKADEAYAAPDFERKVLHVTAHPSEPEVAAAVMSQVHVFQGR